MGQLRQAGSAGAVVALTPPKLLADLNLQGNEPAVTEYATVQGTALGTVTFFPADDGLHGTELWVTDGSAAGTRLVKDVGDANDAPRGLTAFNGKVYYSMGTAETGAELWVSDGTSNGTVQLAELMPGSAGSSPTGFTELGGKLLFFTYDKIWTTDGTFGGTNAFKAFGSMVFPSRLLAHGGKVYFKAGQNLWVTDGTEAGTLELTQASVGDEVVALDASTVLFRGQDNTSGLELWKSDGTVQGTQLLKDIKPGGAYDWSLPFNFIKVGSSVIFYADDGVHGGEPWITDGTANGTQLLVDVNPGSGASYYPAVDAQPVPVGNVAVFPADDGVHGIEPWVTDGTAAGTFLLSDLVPGADGSSPTSGSVINGRAIFFTVKGSEREYWSTDGTPAGTTRIVGTMGQQYFKHGFTEGVGGKGYGLVSPAVPGIVSLWTTDGTESGTSFFFSPNTTTRGSQLGQFTFANGRVYFVGGMGSEQALYEVVGGNPSKLIMPGACLFPSLRVGLGRLFVSCDGSPGDLWVTDGSAQGWVNLGAVELYGDLVEVGDTLLFKGKVSSSGWELWATDGTQGGTGLLKDLWPGQSPIDPKCHCTGEPECDCNPRAYDGMESAPVALGDHAYFMGSDGTSRGLWRTDGTGPGTTFVKAIQAFGSLSRPMAVWNGKLFFPGEVDGEVWASDGTPGGTGLAMTVGAANAAVLRLYALPNTLLVLANDSEHGQEFWKTDGTPGGTQLLKEIGPGADAGVLIGSEKVFGDRLYFAGVDPTYPYSVWVTDGTEAGTENLGVNGLNMEVLGAVRGVTLFSTMDGVWQTDGTSAGTVRFSQDAQGRTFQSNMPQGSVKAGSRIYFSACTVEAGCEPYVFPGGNPPTVTCPSNVTEDLVTGPSLSVTYPAATATDPAGTPTLTYSQASGTDFPAGVTLVTVTASTAQTGEYDECTFKVKVNDRGLPTVSCPADVTVEATSQDGATGAYAPASATDNVGVTSLTYTVAAESTFALGETTVTATAKDAAGNEGTCSFKVKVQDTTAPAFTCPQPQTLEATSPSGAVAVYSAQGTDAVSDATVTFTPPSGSTFALGPTTVAGSAVDGASNATNCTFSISVVDTVKPSITCPDAQTLEATSPAGAVATFQATATDVASVPAVIYSAAPGSSFALGTTLVTALATDGSGNTESCGVSIDVVDTTKPASPCPADITAEASSVDGAAVTFALLAEDVASTPAVTSSKVSGETFPFGTTTVSASSEDPSGNKTDCSFLVTVADTLSPTKPCPEDITAEATSSEGAAVEFELKAEDAASTPEVVADHASGETFSLGETVVSASSTDARGNKAECTFKVTVKDTTAPSITCPETVSRVLAFGKTAGAVQWQRPLAKDAVSVPTVTYDKSMQSEFSLGKTTVTATATDVAGNSATCTFDVVVDALSNQSHSPSGVSCSTVAPSAASPWLIAGLLAFLRRRRKGAGAVVVAVGLLPGLATAAEDTTFEKQAFNAERFRGTLDTNGIISVESATARTAGTVTANIWIGQTENTSQLFFDDQLIGTPIGRRVGAGLTVSYAFTNWLQLGAELPFVLSQAMGDWARPDVLSPFGPSATNGLGDLRLVPKFALLGQEKHGVNVAVVPGFTLPTGGARAYRGEAGVSFQPEVLLSREFSTWRVGGSLRAPMRSAYGSFGVSNVMLGLGAAKRFQKVELAASLDGSVALYSAVQDRGESDLEGRAQFAYDIGYGVSARAGLGGGFIQALGVPSMRIYGGLAWECGPKPAAPVVVEPPKPVDSDNDGIVDSEDACPSEAGVARLKGCAEKDTDGDGVMDDADGCPAEKGIAAEKGCPEKDTDGDGFVDSADGCPEVKGVASEKGCPEKDSDGDAVVDSEDKCPAEAGTAEMQGCKPKVELKAGAIQINESVLFAVNKDVIDQQSFGLLDSVAELLQAHAEVKKVQVEGHTDASGNAGTNMTLSSKRAAAVVKYLVDKGVEKARLSSKGFGGTRPIADNETDEGKARNRRVVFTVLEPKAN